MTLDMTASPDQRSKYRALVLFDNAFYSKYRVESPQNSSLGESHHAPGSDLPFRTSLVTLFTQSRYSQTLEAQELLDVRERGRGVCRALRFCNSVVQKYLRGERRMASVH
jgi:hypothetical protein